MDIKSVSSCVDHNLKLFDARQLTEFVYPITASDLLELPACPLCGSAQAERVAEVRDASGLLFFATQLCARCLHVWRSISPSRHWFRQRWQQIATGELQVFNPTLEAARAERYGQYRDLLVEAGAKGRLLDIGAAYGSGTRVLQEAGFEVEAVEPEDDRANYIRTALGISTYAHPVEDLQPAGTYDVILCAHCLEHLDEPGKVLTRMAEWLKPAGLLYLEVPLAEHFIDWRDALFMAHKSNFTARNAMRLAEQCGFSVVQALWVRENDDGVEHHGLGLLLAKGSEMQEHQRWAEFDSPGLDAARLRALYRRGLPTGPLQHDQGALRYAVPYLNHFYYIVRTHQGHFVDRTASQGIIEFVKDAQPEEENPA